MRPGFRLSFCYYARRADVDCILLPLALDSACLERGDPLFLRREGYATERVDKLDPGKAVHYNSACQSRCSVGIPRPGEEGDVLAEVIVGENETFEAALKRFSKKVQQDGVLTEARRREHFDKPSVRRKKKEAAKRRKNRK